MTAPFGDIRTEDLVRASSWLAHWARADDAAALNHVLADAHAADRLAELLLAVCHVLAHMQPGVFAPSEAEWWSGTALMLAGDGQRTDEQLVIDEDLRLACSFLAHFCRQDMLGVNAVLERTGPRISFLFQALCAVLRPVMDDRWFDSEVAPREWARVAAWFASA